MTGDSPARDGESPSDPSSGPAELPSTSAAHERSANGAMRALGHGVPSERMLLEMSMAGARGNGKSLKQSVTKRQITNFRRDALRVAEGI